MLGTAYAVESHVHAEIRDTQPDNPNVTVYDSGWRVLHASGIQRHYNEIVICFAQAHG